MAKRKFRIEGGRYGGEFVCGEVNDNFVRHFADKGESDLINALLAPSEPLIPYEGYSIWENDDIEHLNSPYDADSRFFITEITNLDDEFDDDYENQIEAQGYLLYFREGALYGNEEPGVSENISEQELKDMNFVPVLSFHSAEKGRFGVWFFETDEEDFDPYKLAYGSVETNFGDFIDRVYYDGEELEVNHDYDESTGKADHADVGWLCKKLRNPSDLYDGSKEDALEFEWEELNDLVALDKKTREKTTMDNDKKNDEKDNGIENDSDESKVFDSDEEAEAYLEEHLDDDWDEGFDYGDDEEQETSK